MKCKPFLLLLTLLGCCAAGAKGQDSSLLHLLEDTADQRAPREVSSTFKATQIVNAPTVESPARRALQFMIMHRFGKVNEGAYALFGLDNASIRFAFDYGLTDNVALGVGRSSFEKVYDASVKWRLIRQAEGGFPFTVSAFALLAHNTQRYADKPYLNARLRTMYSSQLLVARKFSQRLSLQLSPAWNHFNLVAAPEDRSEVFTLGAGGRYKVSNRVSLTGEYNYLFPGQVISVPVYNSLSAGVDIETGGHVFQLVFTNAQGMVAPYYLARTDGAWREGDIYFGFNVTRIFQTGRKRQQKAAAEGRDAGYNNPQ